MSLQPNIKLVISIIQKAITQAPIDKQPLINNKLFRLVEKYKNISNESNDPSYLKQLEFNLNFMKLSFPHLDYSPPIQTLPEQSQKGQGAKEGKGRQEFFELENKEAILKFVQETEKAQAGVRQEVEFSNWGAGNIDPQDLRRHKQLLKRQYFSGQFWKDRPKPASPTVSYLMGMMQNQAEKKSQKIEIKDDPIPEFSHDPDLNWEKVKR